MGTWSIGYLEVVFRKLLGPARLSAVQAYGSSKEFEVFVIRDYTYGLWGANQASMPFFI